MKRLSITHSDDLQRFLKYNLPSKGIIEAFQMGADIWMRIAAGQGKVRPYITAMVLSTCIERFSDMYRITYSYSFVYPSVENTESNRRVVRLEIVGYKKGQREKTCNLIILFDYLTGEIIMSS